MTKKTSQKYSESLNRLDAILTELDNPDANVDELSEKVEEAAELLRSCKDMLQKTEQKVNRVLDDLAGEFAEN